MTHKQSAELTEPGVGALASSHTSCSSHCFNRSQQVAGEGYLSGRKRHAEPVRSTHKMPSRQSRLEAQGRPRLSLRRFGSGSSGSINSHCASVNNSNRFLLMQKAHQTIRLIQSLYLEAEPIYETRSRKRVVWYCASHAPGLPGDLREDVLQECVLVLETRD